VAIPLKDILSAKAKAPDAVKTVILVTGGVVVGGVVAYLMTQQNSTPPSASNVVPVCTDPDGC
jgi:hypothetical protein